MSTALALLALLTAAPPATRVAVVFEDPSGAQPARAALEAALQSRGYEVVSKEISQDMRPAIAPKALLGSRLPEGLSVFEADAILAGASAYGEPNDVEGVKSVQVTITARLIDLGTGRTTSTLEASGVGVGVQGPALMARGAQQAVQQLFKNGGLVDALKNVGQEAGMVTLIVHGVPSREALLELRNGLERALAGAPVKEVYFARGLGKLVLGGSNAKSMIGPQIADVLSETKTLALTVDEVANTRIVASYNKARAVHVHALVLEPKTPKRSKISSEELGRYMATRFATFEFARATFQAGRLDRKQALARAAEIGAGVIVESEVLGGARGSALAIRVLDAKTGRPIYREQAVIAQDGNDFAAVEGMLAQLKTQLPERLGAPSDAPQKTPAESEAPAVAKEQR
jgi:hypothetical protein